MNTTTNTREVSEAFNWTEFWNRVSQSFSSKDVDEIHACYEAGKRAALSAERAAQGDAVAWQYRRLDEEEGPSPYWHHMTREQYEMFRDNPRSNCEVRQLFTAPPAQPAERVPEWLHHRLTWLADITSDPAMDHLPSERARIHRYACEVRDEVARLNAASPAPSEGGKGVDRG